MQAGKSNATELEGFVLQVDTDPHLRRFPQPEVMEATHILLARKGIDFGENSGTKNC